jgi:transcription elongation GreA/GreB family factor
MHNHSTTLTTFGIEKLRARFNHLKERYDSITQDLREKTQSHSILAIKSIEKEIIFSDMIKMETILSNAKVHEKGAKPLWAEQGTKVMYQQKDTGIHHEVILVDPLEADPLEGFVSVQSPVGSMLLGRQVGDSVTIATPKGSLHLTVTSLE